MPAAYNRVSDDGLTAQRRTADSQFDAFDDWAEEFDIPLNTARAAWRAARDYWIPKKDRDAIRQFQNELYAKYKAEEDIDFSSIEDERITRENLAVAINADPDHPLVRSGLKKYLNTSPKLTFNPGQHTVAHYQRRITNQNGANQNDTKGVAEAE